MGKYVTSNFLWGTPLKHTLGYMFTIRNSELRNKLLDGKVEGIFSVRGEVESGTPHKTDLHKIPFNPPLVTATLPLIAAY